MYGLIVMIILFAVFGLGYYWGVKNLFKTNIKIVLMRILRYKRIIKHLYLFFKTGYHMHLLEVEHYYLMNQFKR